ncbi:hypothetical protein [Demequina mangrovi]|uniref:Uncharacterized protein n=1 Tax=Demequina mangrovi TaxID=1043493 RepID=A0A1H6WRA6_9MICO|nr:hypothetical protein [Demequina mangrovi]SEJ19393.1 hypothetical protein SAMN05421637_1107 [Demequina mangrovi]
MTLVEGVAWATAGLLVLVAIFQVALAAGAPWGEAAWGGTHRGTLPVRLRVGSAFSALVLCGMAAAVLAGAGVIGDGRTTAITVVLWVIVGFLALTMLGNLASRSPRERAVFGPISSLLLAGAVIVAVAG